MMGQWALYHDGWFLSTKVNRAPWEAFGPANPDPLNNQTLQLFNLNKDFSQTEDLAAKNPQKVKEMKEMFIAEAKKYQVFPLDASVAARSDRAAPEHHRRSLGVRLHAADDRTAAGQFAAAAEHLLHDHRRHRGAGRRRRGHDPDLGRTLRRLRLLPAEGQAGVPVEHARPRAHQVGRPRGVVAGRHTVEFDFKYEGIGVGTLEYNNFSGLAQPGTGTLKVDGKAVATKRMEKTLPMILQWDESFDIGSDTLTGVNDADYKPPFPLTAKLNKLTIKVDRPQLSPEDIKKLQAAMQAASDGPVGEDLDLVQKIEMRVDKREDCRKQADAKKLGPIERIGFVRECIE